MATSGPYSVQFDFSNYQASNPADPLPGDKLDTELANIATAFNGAEANLADIRRDDGALKNGIVTADSLAPDLETAIVDLASSAAETSSTAAATSAGAAAASAAAAAISANNAGAFAGSASNFFASFGKFYLGAASNAPSLDAAGNALETGALYYQSSGDSPGMRIWGGAAWETAFAPSEGFPTTSDVDDLIAAAIAPLATSADVTSDIAAAVAPLATSADVTSDIAAAVAPLATSADVTSDIAAAIAPLATSADVMSDIAAAIAAILLPRGHIAGLQLSNDATTPNSVLDISAGQCVDSAVSTWIALAALTKSTAGAWAAGNGAHGMGNGLTIAVGTAYNVFAIINGGSADIYFDTSPTAANAPAGTTAHRRIGAFVTDGSAHIIAFSQNGDEFLLSASEPVISSLSVTTTAALEGIFGIGVKVNVLLRGDITSATNHAALRISSPDENSVAGGSLVSGDYTGIVEDASGFAALGLLNVRVNTSGQIRVVATATLTLNLVLVGWIDTRGRFD